MTENSKGQWFKQDRNIFSSCLSEIRRCKTGHSKFTKSSRVQTPLVSLSAIITRVRVILLRPSSSLQILDGTKEQRMQGCTIVISQGTWSEAAKLFFFFPLTSRWLECNHKIIPSHRKARKHRAFLEYGRSTRLGFTLWVCLNFSSSGKNFSQKKRETLYTPDTINYKERQPLPPELHFAQVNDLGNSHLIWLLFNTFLSWTPGRVSLTWPCTSQTSHL